MSTSTLSCSVASALLLSADDPREARTWDALVDSAYRSDVYYRPGYARAYEQIGHGKAVAFVIEILGVRALFPLLIRPLKTLPFTHGEHGSDAATPYGYGGVVLLDGLERVDQVQGLALLNEFRECCNQNGIISAYVRLHPMTHQSEWFTNATDQGVELFSHGPTTAINVSCWRSEEAARVAMRKNRRADLKLAQSRLHVTWTSEGRDHGEDLRVLFELYERRMTQLGAGDYYHFPLPYYELLAQGLGVRLDVAIAWLGDQPVGAGMFFMDGAVAHYHLSATNDLGRKFAANTLFLHAAAQRAWRRKCVHLHLGGGVSGEDQLFAFKKSFGGPTYQYFSLGVVCDRRAYRKLVDERACAQELPPMRPGFFPQYRA